MSEKSVTEQSGEGPSNGGIARSEFPTDNVEQSGEGPGNGGIPRSATGKSGVKRKLETKTIEEKYWAILEIEKGHKSKTEIAKMFNVPKTTLSGWLKKADSIKEGFSKFGPKRNLMRVGEFTEIDAAVLKWFTEARNGNIAISGPIILDKARFFAEKLGFSEFRASTGWLDRFKERHNISFKKICGELKSVDLASKELGDWDDLLATILTKFEPRDIYNADETGIFYKMQPDKTMEFKNVDCHGGKKSKERLSVLVCANMDGSDKLPLLVIGKSANPRCFKGVKTLPTHYESQTRAWMTSDIFCKWLNKLDRRMTREKRKIALVVDNCPSHPRSASRNLSSVQLFFLPPNTTSKTQPMDQGVIYSLKEKYKRQVITKKVIAMDNKKDFAISVLDAMHMMRQAWQLVTQTTIVNCFRNSNFVTEMPRHTPDDDEDPDDNIPLSRLARLGEIDVDDFIRIDLDLPTSAPSTDDSIVETIIEARTVEETEIEEDEQQPPPAPP